MANASVTIDERARALIACAAEWQDRNSEVRQRARRAFRDSEWPPEVVEVALDNVLDGAGNLLDPAAHSAQVLRTHANAALQNVLAILPGNVIGPTIATAFCAAAAGATIMLKSSSRELALAEILADQFQSHGTLFDGTITPMRWTGGDEDFEAKIFHRASRIVAFGDDATIADIRRRAPDGVAVIGYGSAYSLGFVSAGSDVMKAAEGAACDIALFDQRGCLSPQTIYVEGTSSKAFLFAHALAKALGDIGKALPRASAGEAEKAAVADFIRRLMVRAVPSGGHSLDSVIVGPRDQSVAQYVIGVEEFGTPVCAGFGRIVIVKPCRSISEAMLAAKSLAHQLDTIGIADAITPQIQSAAAGSGATRICVLGQMQRPPLGYRPKMVDFLSLDSA